MVGTFVTPYLAAQHELRVPDLRPPRHTDLRRLRAGLHSTEPGDLARALDGMDTFIDLVMRPGGDSATPTVEDIIANYEVNTLGVHLLLSDAHQQGIRAGIYVSTRTVHNLPPTPDGRPMYYQAEETMVVDNPTVYGLTKGIGERLLLPVFRAALRDAPRRARITGPRTREAFLDERRTPVHPGLYVMDEEDLANALLAALRVVMVGRARFDAILIAADEREVDHNLTKAKTLLGWEPAGHRLLEAD